MNDGATLNSSTLHLHAFQKLDKTRFITSYIQTQRSYLGAHAADGRREQERWAGESRTPTSDEKPASTASPRKPQINDFSTPVMKARVPCSDLKHKKTDGGNISTSCLSGSSPIRNVSPTTPTLKLSKPCKAKENTLPESLDPPRQRRAGVSPSMAQNKDRKRKREMGSDEEHNTSL